MKKKKNNTMGQIHVKELATVHWVVVCESLWQKMKTKMIPTKLSNENGSALILALVLVVVITTIIVITIAGVFSNIKFTMSELNRTKAFYLAEAGIHKSIWFLSGNGGKSLQWRPKDESITLFDGLTSHVTVTQWGGFLQVTSKVKFKNQRKTLTVLLGQRPIQPFTRAIHIGKMNYPLVVAGKTQITGDIAVGRKGIKKGRIKGREYEGDKLVDGEIIIQDQPKMPGFNPVVFNTSINRYETQLRVPQGMQFFQPLLLNDPGIISQVLGKYIYVHGDIQIHNLRIAGTSDGLISIISSGNIIITGSTQLAGSIECIAGGKIIIKDDAYLRNIIIYAKKGIDVTGTSKIEGQLFSPAHITVTDKAILKYPSVVYCSGTNDKNILKGKIELKGQCVVYGSIIMSGNHLLSDRNETLVKIDINAKLVGVVYASNEIALEGTVYGSVVTGGITFYLSPTTYLNWLYDVEIDRTKLPDNFLLPLYFDQKPKLDILRWETM